MIDLCLPRSPGNLLALIQARDVEHNPVYQATDGETHCNQFVRDVLADMGVPFPRSDWYAHQQIDHLGSDAGRVDGWRLCLTSEDAAHQANMGRPVVATYRNPIEPPAAHSHIAIVVPAVGGAGPNVAQAGFSNFSNKPVGRGFGAHRVIYFFNA